jgi:predicted transcriptional regulator
MTDRTLTITLQPDWQGARRLAAQRAQARHYAGEVLNFETPSAFFAHLTDRRWALVHRLQAAWPMAVRELARRVGRDVKRVHAPSALAA